MRIPIYIALLGCLLLVAGCEVQFKTLELEDPKAKYFKPVVGLGDFKSTEIFINSSRDAWGIEKDDCKEIRLIEDPVDASNSVIAMEWNRYACEWAGMGIGWDGYAGKDLSGVMETGAIEFRLRSIEGETTIPTIIFLLEDYSGTFCAAVFGSAALESYPINEDWQTAVIPLDAFPYEEDGLDVSNIKQLVMELQGLGSIMIDEMRIVEFQPRVIAGKKVFPPSVVPLEPSIEIFDDAFSQVWGLTEMPCRTYALVDSAASSGNKSIYMKWNDEEGCEWMNWGTSWTEWKAVNMESKLDQVALEFYVKTTTVIRPELPLQVGFESYNYASTFLPLTSEWSEQSQYGMEWTRVRIPLSAFEWERDGTDPTNIKQLLFKGAESGEVFIDEIRLVPITDNE